MSPQWAETAAAHVVAATATRRGITATTEIADATCEHPRGHWIQIWWPQLNCIYSMNKLYNSNNENK